MSSPNFNMVIMQIAVDSGLNKEKQTLQSNLAWQKTIQSRYNTFLEPSSIKSQEILNSLFGNYFMWKKIQSPLYRKKQNILFCYTVLPQTINFPSTAEPLPVL